MPIRAPHREFLLQTCLFLLVMLWSYTAVSKWSAPAAFRTSLSRQPLGMVPVELIFYALPSTELIAAMLLCIKKTRKLGLSLSLLLMLGFTLYVALTLAGAFGSVPCACGGVIQHMGWKAHLYFNLFFLAISMLGSWLDHQKRTQKVTAGSGSQR